MQTALYIFNIFEKYFPNREISSNLVTLLDVSFQEKDGCKKNSKWTKGRKWRLHPEDRPTYIQTKPCLGLNVHTCFQFRLCC
jgi:hypothetical protein